MNKHSVSSGIEEKSKITLTEFDYPADIDRLDSLNLVIGYSEIEDVAKAKDLNLVLRYNDSNYSVFVYDFRTTLLHDKKEGFVFCFKRSVDFRTFSRESIEIIYVLDKDLMPEFSIGYLPDSRECIIEKYLINRDPQSFIVKINGEKDVILRDLRYDDIIELTKQLKNGQYVFTGEQGFCCESSHFSVTPFWVER